MVAEALSTGAEVATVTRGNGPATCRGITTWHDPPWLNIQPKPRSPMPFWTETVCAGAGREYDKPVAAARNGTRMKARRLKVSVFVAMMGLLPGVSWLAAQDAAPPTIALDEDGLNETVREGALISGAVVAGVLVREAADTGISLQGFIPADWDEGGVCAQLTSIDGLYEATGRYTVPAAWQGGIAALAFPTEHAALLRNVPQDGLAIRVTPGTCGQGASDEFSVALWNTSELDRVDLLLNSFRADGVFVYVDDRDQPVRCAAIDHPARTAFDSKCTVALDELSGPVQLEVYRIVDGQPAAPDTLTIRLPGAQP